MKEREEAFQLLRKQLLKAQDQTKIQADKKRTERKFEVGDLVFLKLQPYLQQSIERRGNQKLSPKFYRPYKVIQRIGKAA